MARIRREIKKFFRGPGLLEDIGLQRGQPTCRLERLQRIGTGVVESIRCARLRQAVLKRAFEGRLVPAETPVEATAAPAASAAP